LLQSERKGTMLLDARPIQAGRGGPERRMGKQRKRDPELTRASILDAAESEFLSKGFGQTSVSDIARRARVTKSLVHHYFGSKDGLWVEVKLRRFSMYKEKQMAMLKDAEATDDLLIESIRTYFYHFQNNPEIARLLAWMFLEEDKDKTCGEMERELIEAGVRKIQDGQAKGVFRKDLDPLFILLTFIGLVQHWFQQRGHYCRDLGIRTPMEQLDNAYLRDMVKILMDGIRQVNREDS
jgi:TetR/AcrR family transcriptional regulator